MNCNYLIKTFNDPTLDKRRNKHFDRFADHLIKEIQTRLPAAQVAREIRIKINDAYSKKIDLGVDRQGNSHHIELKSISSSFGKNANNRIEEMAGQALLLSANGLGKADFSYIFVFSGDYKNLHYEKIKNIMKQLKNNKLLYNFALIEVKSNRIIHDNDYSIKDFLGKL